MNLLDPDCGLDPEERREILLHTDAGRTAIATEDEEMSRAVHFANGLPPGWSVGAYVRGPNKGKPCLIKGVRGTPGVQVKPIPEGYEPDQQGGLRRKGGGDTTQATPAATSSEPPHPLAAIPTRSEKFNRLVAMAGQEREHLRGSQNRFTDPLGVFTKGPPPSLNVRAFLNDLIGTAARHHFNTSTDVPLQDLYDTVGRKHGLSKHGFLQAVGDIFNRHTRTRSPFFLDRYSGSPGDLQTSGHDPELLMITPSGSISNALRLDQSEVPGEMQLHGLRGDQTLETPLSRRRLAESGRPVPPTQPLPLTPSATPDPIDRHLSKVDAAKRVIGSLMASALSTRGDKVRVRNTVHSHLRNLQRSEIDQVAAHVGVTRKLPNKRAVLDAIADRIIEQKGAYARGTE